MPGEPIGDKTILAYRDQRFKLEQLLALDVVEAITTTPSLIEPLRRSRRYSRLLGAAAVPKPQRRSGRPLQGSPASRSGRRREPVPA
jgi:hypothetical protein